MSSNQTKIVFDFELWSVGDYVNFIKATVRDDLIRGMDIARKAIVEWDLPYDLKDSSISEKMKFREVGAVISLATAEFQRMFSEDAALEGVEVDLNNWNLREWEEYKSALKDGDMDLLAQSMEAVVVKHPYSVKLKELNFEQFGHINAAIQRKVRHEFKSGK